MQVGEEHFEALHPRALGRVFFDPASGGTVLFGPAGRPLPQLPLEVDASRHLRAAGTFDEAVGPSWWGVRMGKPHT